MSDVAIASMRLILRLRPGTVLKPVAPPEDIWRRFWWWTEKIETESSRRIFDCRSFYCHLFKYNDVRESVQFDPQVHHEKISIDYLQTYGWLVQFDELEIDDFAPSPMNS